MARRFTDQELVEAVQSSFSIARVLKILRLSATGGNYRAMYCHFARLGLDTSHFTGKGHLKGKRHDWNVKQPLAEILIQNSTYRTTSRLKKRLIKEGLLLNQCCQCGLGPVWLDKPLVLVLDHVNGDCTDNRIENLRLLCPNCNSQQDTFAGKNKGRYPRVCSVQDSAEPAARARAGKPPTRAPASAPVAQDGLSVGSAAALRDDPPVSSFVPK